MTPKENQSIITPVHSISAPQIVDEFTHAKHWIKSKSDDIYALNLLQPLLINYPFLPITGSSIRPASLVHICNNVIVNKRETIVEFGSGISSILIARLIKSSHIPCKIISVEHDEDWKNAMDILINVESLQNILTIIHAPLKRQKISKQTGNWYDVDILQQNIPNDIDLAIIDGPPAWKQSTELARYPALPFIISKLSKKAVVYLDDANRNGEKKVLTKWRNEFDVKFNYSGDTLAYMTWGDTFHVDPSQYYGI